MNYLHLLSWYYQGAGGESIAREFFQKLVTGVEKGIKFPLDCPFQVALVHCTVDEHWCVGVLVMRGTTGDDSIEQSDMLQKWYREAGAKVDSAESNTSPATHPSVEGTLQSRYGNHYRSIETFGSNEVASTDISVQQKSSLRCEKCGVETEAGNAYQFYYGKPAGERKYAKDGKQIVEMKFNIAGTQHAYICNQCVAIKELANRRTGMRSILILGLGLIALFVLSYVTDVLLFLGVIALLLGILGLVLAFFAFQKWQTLSKLLKSSNNSRALDKLAKSNTDVGDELSIEVHRSSLEKQGFPLLLTRGAYKYSKSNYN